MVPGMERATRRVVAVGALLVLVGVALRGYLPGQSRAPDHPSGSNPAATIAVIALVGVAMVIIALAVVANLRRPRSPRHTGEPLGRKFGGDRTKLTWRMALVLLGVLLAWLTVVVLLMQASGLVDFDPPEQPVAPSTPTQTPAPTSSPRPPSPDPPQQEGPLFWFLLVATIVMMLVWAAGLIFAVRGQRRPVSSSSGPPSADQPPRPQASQPLALAAERGLAEMGDLSREPREAIIACYAAMEDALADAPGASPQDSDTPSEVLARAVEHDAIHSGSATELVDLFAEARFSLHVMSEEHREIALRALELVLDELRSPA
jgi:hypothetical protein